jgi:hypothetical protein
MADGAARRRTRHAMVAGDMSCHAADGRALQAALGGCQSRQGGYRSRQRKRDESVVHDFSPVLSNVPPCGNYRIDNRRRKKLLCRRSGLSF